MTFKNRVFLFLLDLFYWPLRLVYPRCQLDRAWMIQSFKKSKCKPLYCDTPDRIITKMIKAYAWVRPGAIFKRFKILEPEFGTGVMLNRLREYFHSPTHGTDVEIVGFEISPAIFWNALKRMGYHHHADLKTMLLTTKPYRLYNLDFLKWNGPDLFDAIFMVPPFADKDFMQHLYKAGTLLADNGVLVAVIPEAVFRSHNLASIAFRHWLAQFSCNHCSLGRAVCSYPVSVVLLTIVNDHPGQLKPIFDEYRSTGSIL